MVKLKKLGNGRDYYWKGGGHVVAVEAGHKKGWYAQVLPDGANPADYRGNEVLTSCYQPTLRKVRVWIRRVVAGGNLDLWQASEEFTAFLRCGYEGQVVTDFEAGFGYALQLLFRNFDSDRPQMLREVEDRAERVREAQRALRAKWEAERAAS